MGAEPPSVPGVLPGVCVGGYRARGCSGRVPWPVKSCAGWGTPNSAWRQLCGGNWDGGNGWAIASRGAVVSWLP